MKQVYKRTNKCKDWKELERLAVLYLLSGGIRCQFEYYNSDKFPSFNLLEHIMGKGEAGRHSQSEYTI